MTIHTIKVPVDWGDEGEYRKIIWDDETGAVTGDHPDVQGIKDDLAKPRPLVLGWDQGEWVLPDPAHDPAQFLRVVWYNLTGKEASDMILPDTLEGVEMAGGPRYHVSYELPPGAIY